MADTNNTGDNCALAFLAEHFTDEEMCEMMPDEDEDYFYMENW